MIKNIGSNGLKLPTNGKGTSTDFKIPNSNNIYGDYFNSVGGGQSNITDDGADKISAINKKTGWLDLFNSLGGWIKDLFGNFGKKTEFSANPTSDNVIETTNKDIQTDGAITPPVSAIEETGKKQETTTEPPSTEQPMSYEEYMESLKQQAAEDKAKADKEAEIAKEKAMTDAQASYMQNMATYGKNAEQLAQMGLTGGGYSDYLNAQAYAQKRSDAQSANAVEAATKSNNQATYQEYIGSINQQMAEKAENDKLLEEQKQQAEQDRKDKLYASLWEGVQNPDSGYTAESVTALGKEYGLSDEQIKSLTDTLAAREKKTEEDTSKGLYEQGIADLENNGANLSDGYLDGLKDLGMNEEDFNSLQAKYQVKVFEDYMEKIKGGYNDTKAIDSAHEKGNLTDEQYNSLKSEWNSSIDTGGSFFTNDDSYLNKKEAKKALDSVLGNAWSNDATKAAIQKTYNELYGIKKSDIKFNNDGGWWIFGSTDLASEGNNFSLIDGDGFKYRIESGGEVQDSFIKSLFADEGEGVYGYDGKIYYKSAGKVILVKQRATSYDDHYKKLYARVFG